MKREDKSGISFFQRYLTIWVILCMVLGILIGKYLPGIPAFLNRFEYARVSIPMAILIWLMIYPMMMKVDFQSIKMLVEIRRIPGRAVELFVTGMEIFSERIRISGLCE